MKPGWGSIHDIAVDNLGNVWLATEKWGLLRYSGQAWIAYPELLGLGAKGGPIPASAVALDARGRLWVAGGERVARFDGRTWQVRTVVGGTHFVNISQFIPDPGGGTWAIHRDEMLSYLDDDSWWTYTQADGLPSQIYEGAQHPLTRRLWLSTEAGLVRFDGPSWEHLRLDAP